MRFLEVVSDKKLLMDVYSMPRLTDDEDSVASESPVAFDNLADEQIELMGDVPLYLLSGQQKVFGDNPGIDNNGLRLIIDL